MKKALFLFLALCFLATSVYARSSQNLYDKFESNRDIKVYLKDVKNTSDNQAVNANVFKDVFGDVLRRRLNIQFVSVNNAKDADVVITCDIEKYVFTGKAMPSFFGAQSLAADTAAPKSQAILTVDYKVLSPKSGRLMFEARNFTTTERRPIKHMEGASAFKYAAEKNINRFLYRTFHKQKHKRRY